MSRITFGEAKQILAKYAERGGLCPTDPRVPAFVREVLDYMLISGANGNLRKFCFCAVKGCLTIPYELETPLKVKVDNCIGSVWDQWFEYHSAKDLGDGCMPADRALFEEPFYYPTVYDLPQGGSRVGCMAFACEDPSAHIIVKGFDPTGREIITYHEGQQVVGEYLQIKQGEIRYTEVVFGKITDIVKSPTIGYVQLLWVNPALNKKGFLADYSPLETAPQYKRFRLTDGRWCTGVNKVEILGRIRLKAAYTDSDYIPFDNRYALNLSGQSVNANFNRSPDLAKANDAFMTEMIERENSFKRVQNGQPVEFFLPLSGGAIKNIV